MDPYYNVFNTFSPSQITDVTSNTGSLSVVSAIQSAVTAALAAGQSLLFPSGTYLLDDNLFFYGELDIVGESMETVVWKQDLKSGDGADSNKYHIVFGVPSFGGVADPWNGTISGIKFKTTAAAIFERGLFIIASNRCVVRNCWWDYTATNFTTTAAGGPIESGSNSTWASSGSVFGSCKLLNNRVDLNHGFNASEGLGLTQFNLAVIDGNEVYGSADDWGALHKVNEGYITNNVATSITGRALLDHVKYGFVANNIMTRIEDPHTSTWHLSNFIEVLMSSSDIHATANLDTTISNNKMIAPEGALIAYWIRTQGTQLSLTVDDNTFNNESSDGDGSAISIEAAVPGGSGSSWVGPSGNPDSGTGGIVRVRNVTLRNNKDIGSIAIAKIQCLGTASNFLKGFALDENMVVGYDLTLPNAAYGKSNAALSTLMGISLASCHDTDDAAFTFTGLNNTYQSGSKLTATSVSTVYRARYTGRIMGASLNCNQTGTSGQTVWSEILINGGSAKSFNTSIGSNTYNNSSFTNDTGLEIAAGDLITVKVWCTSGQLVALQGSVIVHMMPRNT